MKVNEQAIDFFRKNFEINTSASYSLDELTDSMRSVYPFLGAEDASIALLEMGVPYTLVDLIAHYHLEPKK